MNILNKVTANIKGKLDEGSITIPVTQEILQKVLERTTNRIDNIKNLNIRFDDELILISGTIKKLLMPINFQILLEPLKAEKRILFFKVREMKPLNQNWIKDKALNIPPLLSFKDEIETRFKPNR